MPLKRGGGNHMQLYDPRNGEYTDEEKENMRRYDNYAIESYKWNREVSEVKFHFPLEGVHDKEYCKEFVHCIRDDIREPQYNGSKMSYLLRFQIKDDKSKFLKGLGYSESQLLILFNDICRNTRRDTMEFSKFSHGTILLTAKTLLGTRTVKTVWKLDEKLNIHFVTLIPGGHKHGNN